MGNRERNERNDGNATSQDGNAENQGGNTGNQGENSGNEGGNVRNAGNGGGNAGNKVRKRGIEWHRNRKKKTKQKFIKSNFRNIKPRYQGLMLNFNRNVDVWTTCNDPQFSFF